MSLSESKKIYGESSIIHYQSSLYCSLHFLISFISSMSRLFFFYNNFCELQMKCPKILSYIQGHPPPKKKKKDFPFSLSPQTQSTFGRCRQTISSASKKKKRLFLRETIHKEMIIIMTYKQQKGKCPILQRYHGLLSVEDIIF